MSKPASKMDLSADAANTRVEFKSRIDLPQARRDKLVALLNQQLADSFDLQSQIKQAHWNVKGIHFIALHLFFDTLAEEVEVYVDDLAERATSLGGPAHGTVRLAAKNSRLKEFPIEHINGHDALIALADRFATLAASTREAIDSADKLDDAGTSDLFTAISRGLDKSLWFIEAHLQG